MKNKARMSERNKELGMGWQHFDVTEEWIRAECDRHSDDPLIDELYFYSDKDFKSYDSLMRSKSNMKNLNPWNHLISFVVPNRITLHSAWHEHIPFAMFLVDLLRPKMIVELGTHHGDSYCAFCQAVRELHLDTACYAVDTWQGDPQAGFYGPEVLADLRAHHDPLYGSFSRLIQSTFDEALQHFADGTIDLLHIDGYHTYESVKHDFEAWLPKLSRRGVVLFHDINVRERDFGIRRFWDDVKSRYTHFEFLHGHGLGVLAVGNVDAQELSELFLLSEEDTIVIRDLFFQLGHQLTTRVKNEAMASELANQTRHLEGLRADLESRLTHIQHLETQIHGLEAQIHQIHQSIPMQLVGRYHRVIDRLLRPGTLRRGAYELVLSGIRVILNEGLRSFGDKLRKWLGRRLAGDTVLSFPNLYRIRASRAPLVTESSTGTQNNEQDLPPVDVVTVTYNSGAFIRDLVYSLQASNYPPELLSLTITDNGSSDDTLDILDSLSATTALKQFQVLRSKQNLGYGKGVNKAARSGNAPYIMVVNPDVRFTQDCLSTLVRTAVNDTGAWLWEPRQFPYEHPKYYDPVSLDVLWSSGAAFLIRRDKFKEIGGFDESIFLYADDVDLSFRIWNAGGRCRYAPSAVIWHYCYSKPGETKPAQWLYSSIYNLLMRYKFGKPSEIVKGYLLLALVLLRGNSAVHRARARLLRLLLTHPRLVPPVLSWRWRNRSPVFNSMSFMGFDYEMRRLGDFYENRPCSTRPLVTIITRTVQRPLYLRETLRSIVNQTYRPLEVVVVEDSSPSCQTVIDEFSTVPGLSLHYHPLGARSGRCRAGNEGLRLAGGEFINFLDDDDFLFPDHVEVLVQAMLSRDLQYRAAYGASFMVEATYTQEAILPDRFASFFNNYSREELKERNLFPIQAVLFQRDLYDTLGGFDETLDFIEDWDLWLRYARSTDFLPVVKTTSQFHVPKDSRVKSERQYQLDRAYRLVKSRHDIL